VQGGIPEFRAAAINIAVGEMQGLGGVNPHVWPAQNPPGCFHHATLQRPHIRIGRDRRQKFSLVLRNYDRSRGPFSWALRQPPKSIVADRATRLPDSADDTDAVIELSLRLATAARKRLPARLTDSGDEE
jgi:hypothetical protein